MSKIRWVKKKAKTAPIKKSSFFNYFYITVIFILPLAVWMRLGDPSNTLKVFLIRIMSAAFLTIPVIKRKIIVPSKRIMVILAVFALSVILPALYAGHLGGAFIGIYPFYASSVLTSIIFLHIFLYGFNISKNKLYKLLKIISVTGGIVSFYGIIQYLKLDPVGWKGNFYPRIWSTLGNPNFLGAYLAMVIPVTVVWYFNSGKKLLIYLFTVQSVALFMTSSRGGIIAAFAGIFGTLFLLSKIDKGIKFFKKLLVGLIAAVLVVFLLSPTRISKKVINSFNRFSFKDSNVSSRVQQWKAGLKMVEEKPFFGWGTNGFHRQFRKYMPENFLDYTSELSVPGYPHNFLIKILINGGLIFSGLILFVFFYIFRYLYKNFKLLNNMASAVFGSLLALSVQSLFSFSVITTSFIITVELAAVISYKSENRKTLNAGPLVRYILLLPAIMIVVFASNRLLADYLYADADFKAASQKAPEIYKYKMSRAKMLFTRGDYLEAEKLFKEITKEHPYLALSFNGLGSVYRQEGRIDLAIINFNKALQLDPYLVDAHLKIANCYRNKELYRKAEKHYEKALKIRPGLINTRYNLGVVYFKTKRYEKAFKQWNKVLEIKPGHEKAKEGIEILKNMFENQFDN